MAILKNENAYMFAMKRVEELSPYIEEYTPKNDERYIEYDYLVDMIVEYEEEHYKVEAPTLKDVLMLRMHDMHLTQMDVARMLHISQTRVSGLLNGKFEPNMELARRIYLEFKISPSVIIGIGDGVLV